MKAFILAAGLGTRLKPWTDKHPKALVRIKGVPVLDLLLGRLKSEGFNDITVNVHHLADQIVNFVDALYPGEINISDESDELLDTGGGILRAAKFLASDDEPFLVHNVDIISNAPLTEIMKTHKDSGRDISLVTSTRTSSRKLVFDADGILRGWHNLSAKEYRPQGFTPSEDMHEIAFSGIYVVNPSVLHALKNYSEKISSEKFPIMDFLLDPLAQAGKNQLKIGEIELVELNLIDIGKPENLKQAEEFPFD